MKIILAVGLGSFLGGISRYLITVFIQNKFLSTFPFGTMFVNILGCFLIGTIYAMSDKGNVSPVWRMFLATGIMGGFTTFSSFSNETVSMLRDSEYFPAFSYVAISVVVGLAATFAGISVIKYF